MTEHPEGTHVSTQGESPEEQIGLENRLRASWKELRSEQRAGILVAAQLLLAILLFFVDHPLGYAVATAAGLYWIAELPPLPWKLAAQVALVAIFVIASIFA